MLARAISVFLVAAVVMDSGRTSVQARLLLGYSKQGSVLLRQFEGRREMKGQEKFSIEYFKFISRWKEIDYESERDERTAAERMDELLDGQLTSYELEYYFLPETEKDSIKGILQKTKQVYESTDKLHKPEMGYLLGLILSLEPGLPRTKVMELLNSVIENPNAMELLNKSVTDRKQAEGHEIDFDSFQLVRRLRLSIACLQVVRRITGDLEVQRRQRELKRLERDLEIVRRACPQETVEEELKARYESCIAAETNAIRGIINHRKTLWLLNAGLKLKKYDDPTL